MSDLQNQTPADTYKGLLQVGDYTNGVDGNSEYVQDGEGTNSALSISTTKVGVGTVSPSAELDVNGAIESTTLTTSGAVTAGSLIATTGAVNLVGTNTQIFAASNGADIEFKFSATKKAMINNGGLISAGDGSSTVPGFRFTDDADTGMFRPANNEIAFSTASNERMRIDSSGNVGLGIASPSVKLEVNGDILAVGSNVSVSNGGSASGVGMYSPASNEMGLCTNSTEAMRIDSNSNVGIGTADFGANAAGVIGIGNATAPTTAPVDMVQLYAKDDAGSSALYVRNEANTETILSPHAADAPNSLYDRPPGVEEMHRSANYYLGTIVFTNVDRRNALLQKQLNGEELPEDRTFTVTETFAEYNARTGADLQVEDWDANQQAIFDAQEEKVVARQAEIDAWDNEEEEAPEPLESYVKKPKPDWLP